MGVTKVGIIVPRAGFEPTSLAFWVRVLPLPHIGYLMSPLYPCPPVYAAPCLRGQLQTTALPSHVLGIIRIGQKLIVFSVRIMGLSGISVHGADGHVSRVRQHYNWRNNYAVSQVSTHPEMALDVARM